ncbi:MAG: DEAD/DEAH box helicase [Ruminiclostridium sp.]|nr:DEAD/DEAH box helicase [Ruminiclostridium sp.]
MTLSLSTTGEKISCKELTGWLYPEGYCLDWQECDEAPEQNSLSMQQSFYGAYCMDANKALYNLGFSKPEGISSSVNFLWSVSASYISFLTLNPDLELVREKMELKPDPAEAERLIENAPFMNGNEYLTAEWIVQQWGKLHGVFISELTSYQGKVSDYFADKNPAIHPVGRVFFHLVENKNSDNPFAFMATYSSGMTNTGKSKHLPLKNALVEYKNEKDTLLSLLSTVNKAAGKSHFIQELIETGDIFHPIGLEAGEAYTFLKEIPLYEEAGILCRIPNWWKRRAYSPRVSVQIGQKNPSKLGYEAILDYNVRLSVNGEPLSEEELHALMNEAEGLILIKGKWVEVDHARLSETLKAFEKAQRFGSDMNFLEAMRLQWDTAKLSTSMDDDACQVEIEHGEWLKNIVEKMLQPHTVEELHFGDHFHACLREYQKRGFSWLALMKRMGLGACLADDMGLGKTLQVIALINSNLGIKKEKTLLVVPASLIGNWLEEFKKFAPCVKLCVLHPAELKNGAEPSEKKAGELFDVFITTYGMLSRYDWVMAHDWDLLVLDEAQAIKNPGTKQARAAKQVKASFRIAMTGTPIENRLSDLWSLFDFLNQGLLGSASEFTKFIKRMQENEASYARLKTVVAPFILRRSKADKSVIADLPDKIEMKTFAQLTKKQAMLYNNLVNDIQVKLETTGEGMERKGLILSSLMKLKQICNHPDQYMGQQVYSSEESGKFLRLGEICESIYEKRERVLVFTQFREITDHLNQFLETVFHHRGLVLHGETPVKKRKEIVDRFQGKEYIPYLVLSIKAGGVGLNLTAANHVIHFDRWWNPAVENQATDRAFRIGQNKNVIVHKFITKGTIEEKIDALIEEKVKISKEIIPDMQEKWITEFGNQQLMDLFKLT